jgi:hypothetical protein
MSEPMTLRMLRDTIYDCDPHFWRRYPALLEQIVQVVWERFGPRPEIL